MPPTSGNAASSPPSSPTRAAAPSVQAADSDTAAAGTFEQTAAAATTKGERAVSGSLSGSLAGTPTNPEAPKNDGSNEYGDEDSEPNSSIAGDAAEEEEEEEIREIVVPESALRQLPEGEAAGGDVLDGVERMKEEDMSRVQVQYVSNRGILIKEKVTGKDRHNRERIKKICVRHVNDNKFMYVCGKHITAAPVIGSGNHHIHRKNEGVHEITTFAVSHNQRYVAVAERLMDGKGHITIHKTDGWIKAASLSFKFLATTPIVSLMFSYDNKYLITVTAHPDVKVQYWQLGHSVKVIAIAEFTHVVDEASISPWSHQEVCITGQKCFKLLNLKNRVLHVTDLQPKRTAEVEHISGYVGHCWYDDECVVAVTDKCLAIVVEQKEQKKIYRNILGVPGDGGVQKATCCSAIARGFIVGGLGGIVAVFERTYDNTLFAPLLLYRPGIPWDITSVSVSPGESNAIFSHNTNYLSYVTFDDLDQLIHDNLPPLEAVSGEGAMIPVTQPAQNNEVPNIFNKVSHVLFHTDQVTAAATCLQRPIVVTGSLDRTIIVYNYVDHVTLFQYDVEDEVTSLAVHPTGMFVVVGFRYFARVYAILENSLHLCHDIDVKPCYCMQYSNGGQYLAFGIVQRIHIYRATDFVLHGMLVGHGHVVRSLTWGANDLSIASCDAGGSALLWDPIRLKRLEPEAVQKHLILSYSLYDEATQLFASYGSTKLGHNNIQEGEVMVVSSQTGKDAKRKTVRPGQILPKHLAIRKTSTRPLVLCALSQTLVLGSPTGRIMFYYWPLLNDAKPYCYIDAHKGEVLWLLLSPDERFLFSFGADNLSYQFSLEAVREGRYVGKKAFDFDLFHKLMYIPLSDLEEKSGQSWVLRRTIEDRQTHAGAEINTHIARIEAEEKLAKETSIQKQAELQRLLEDHLKGRNIAEESLQKQMHSMEERHLKLAEEVEHTYSKRSHEANQHLAQLHGEKDDLVLRYENRLMLLEREGEMERAQVEEAGKKMEKKLLAEIDALKRKIRYDERVKEAMVGQSMVDCESQLDELRATHVACLASLDEQLSKANNTVLQGEREADRLVKDQQALEQQIVTKIQTASDLQQSLERKTKENEQLRKEMAQRQDTINAAEKRLQVLKTQTTALENLRFVLNYQFEELKKEVGPKDTAIQDLNLQILDRDLQLQAIDADYRVVQQQRLKADEQLAEEKQKIIENQKKIVDKDRRVFVALKEFINISQDAPPQKLKKAMTAALTRFKGKTQHMELESVNSEEKLREFDLQNAAMAKQLAVVVKEHHVSGGDIHAKKLDKMETNRRLVNEITLLREERKDLQHKCTLTEAYLKEARTALHKIADLGPRSLPPTLTSTAVMLIHGPADTLNEAGGRHGKKKPGIGQRKLAPLPSKAKATRRTVLDEAVKQLDQNAHIVERQHEEISQLRDYVHTMLKAEEQRMLSRLSQPLSPSSASAAPSPVAASEIRPPADLGVDWGVEGPRDGSSEPATMGGPSPAMDAARAAAASADVTVNETVGYATPSPGPGADSSVDQVQRMDPVRRPPSSTLK